MQVTYCEKTGKPYTVEYPDNLSIGMHRKGTQVTLPLGNDEWSTLSMPNKVSLIFSNDSQIDLLIERLNKLKKLKEIYNQPVEEVVL